MCVGRSRRRRDLQRARAPRLDPRRAPRPPRAPRLSGPNDTSWATLPAKSWSSGFWKTRPTTGTPGASAPRGLYADLGAPPQRARAPAPGRKRAVQVQQERRLAGAVGAPRRPGGCPARHREADSPARPGTVPAAERQVHGRRGPRRRRVRPAIPRRSPCSQVRPTGALTSAVESTVTRTTAACTTATSASVGGRDGGLLVKHAELAAPVARLPGRAPWRGRAAESGRRRTP